MGGKSFVGYANRSKKIKIIHIAYNINYIWVIVAFDYLLLLYKYVNIK